LFLGFGFTKWSKQKRLSKTKRGFHKITQNIAGVIGVSDRDGAWRYESLRSEIFRKNL